MLEHAQAKDGAEALPLQRGVDFLERAGQVEDPVDALAILRVDADLSRSSK